MDDVFSDVLGKSSSAIIERLLESSDPFDVTYNGIEHSSSANSYRRGCIMFSPVFVL